jgi:hypothetical protein
MKGASKISFEIYPNEEYTMSSPIPGDEIAELTINEYAKNGKIYKTETLIAREKDTSKKTPFIHYGEERILNRPCQDPSKPGCSYFDRYVIVHNRINPNRNFRLLTRTAVFEEKGEIYYVEPSAGVATSSRKQAEAIARKAAELGSKARKFLGY